MKNKLFLFCILMMTMLACTLTMSISPTDAAPVPQPTNTTLPIVETTTPVQPANTSAPATDIPTSAPLAQPSPPTSTVVTYGNLSLKIPPSVADGSSVMDIPRLDTKDAPYWQKTPGHLQIMLGDYYVLQGKSHQPQIHVYPAQAYAEMVPGAFESIRRVNTIIYGSSGIVSESQLPTVPFFNANQAFASNQKVISFQSGVVCVF